MYKHVISLGEACDVPHNIRRVFSVETAHFFDWHVTPFEALLQVIARDLDGVFDEVVLRKNRNTVLDAVYRIQFQHSFSRGPDGLVSPETVGRELEAARSKSRYLRDRWIETLADGGPYLFVVRHAVDQARLDALQALLAKKASGPAHLLCIRYPDHAGDFADRPGLSHAVVRDSIDWKGDPDSWDEALSPYKPAHHPAA